ncbi:MAG TPA: hypothetical protein VNQ90_16460 [Chthoniobacteraceae bacterium]|nr:hypothetical protein [Chthoniobacteraceae bacterium]
MRRPLTTTAFTVTETIVAVAMIAVVAVLALAGLRSVRGHYGKALDLHRMKQIGTTWLLYSQEHQQLPARVSPAAFKVLAQYLGYIKSTNDWSNDGESPKNSIFRNGANEEAIRKLFVSAWDDRPKPDPLNSFSHNEYLGRQGNQELSADSPEWAHRWSEIRRPEIKIFVIPAWFLPRTYANQRFSGATTSNPFRNVNHPAQKGHFPALFADGHVAKVDPAPDHLTLSQINKRWLLPKTEL